eukprot:5157172-Pleurochrysis_carterae.AAC.1
MLREQKTMANAMAEARGEGVAPSSGKARKVQPSTRGRARARTHLHVLALAHTCGGWRGHHCPC